MTTLPSSASRWRSLSRSTALSALIAGLAAALSLGACSDTGSNGGTFPTDSGSAADAAIFDAGTVDTSTVDTSTTDSGTTDSGAADTAAVDSGAADAAVADTNSATDADSADVSVPDVGSDTAAPDTAAPDAGTPDAGTPDAGTPDAGTADATGPTFGAFTPLSCKKFVNKNTDGTVNPFISPARNNQFYVSWVQKGGNLMMNWEAPSSCATVKGPLQVNKTAGDVYYWGGIGVVSDSAGNFYAVWESQTKNAEISIAWSTTGKDFSAPLEVVSTSTNGQDPALLVVSPGVVHAAWRGHHPTKKQYDPYFATASDLFNTKSFSKGVPVQDDAAQDDQVAIAADSKGHLYYAWQSFDGDIFAAKSTNGGKTWTKPLQVNDVTGKANVGKATFLVVTPNDRVVVMWSDKRKQKSGNENDVFSDSSADGLTWGKDVQVNDDDARYQEDPSMAVGTGAKCKGAIYAVWQDFRNKKSYDVYAARSTDGGLTWGKNEAVAKDLQGDEMNPAITVDAGCVIGVAWRDSTKNPSFDIGLTFLTW